MLLSGLSVLHICMRFVRYAKSQRWFFVRFCCAPYTAAMGAMRRMANVRMIYEHSIIKSDTGNIRRRKSNKNGRRTNQLEALISLSSVYAVYAVHVYVCVVPHHPFRHHKLSQRHFDVYFTINNHFSSFFCFPWFPLFRSMIVPVREFSFWYISISLCFCPFSHYSLKLQSKQHFCNVMTCRCQVSFVIYCTQQGK